MFEQNILNMNQSSHNPLYPYFTDGGTEEHRGWACGR